MSRQELRGSVGADHHRQAIGGRQRGPSQRATAPPGERSAQRPCGSRRRSRRRRPPRTRTRRRGCRRTRRRAAAAWPPSPGATRPLRRPRRARPSATAPRPASRASTPPSAPRPPRQPRGVHLLGEQARAEQRDGAASGEAIGDVSPGDPQRRPAREPLDLPFAHGEQPDPAVARELHTCGPLPEAHGVRSRVEDRGSMRRERHDLRRGGWRHRHGDHAANSQSPAHHADDRRRPDRLGDPQAGGGAGAIRPLS